MHTVQTDEELQLTQLGIREEQGAHVSVLFGSTAITKSYHACPLEKSFEGMPLSASIGIVKLLQVVPPFVVDFINQSKLIFCLLNKVKK